MVLQDQPDPGRRGACRRAAQHLRDVLALALDQLRLPGEIGTVEPGGEPQRRAAQCDGPLQPAVDALDADARLIAVARRPHEVPRREQADTGGHGKRCEFDELGRRSIPDVVQVDSDHTCAQRRRIDQHLLDGDGACLQSHVPAERVDAERDRQLNLLVPRGAWACGTADQSLVRNPAVMPPSATTTDPVTYDASSESRNATTAAISAGIGGPVHRHVRSVLGPAFVVGEELVRGRGVHPAGRHGVHADPERREVDRHRSRELAHRALRHVVRDLMLLAHERGGRGGADDRSTVAPGHRAGCRVHHQVHATRVDVHGAVEVLQRRREDLLEVGEPRVRSQEVEPIERDERARHGPFGRLGFADISRDRDHAGSSAPEVGGGLPERTGVLRGGDDAKIRPFRRQAFGDRTPDARRAPGHDGGSAGESTARVSQLLLTEVRVERDGDQPDRGIVDIVEVAGDALDRPPGRNAPHG